MPAPRVPGLGDSRVVPRSLRVVVAALAAVTLLGSCDKGSRQDRFCRRLAKDQSLLSVVPTDPGGLDDFVERYRQLDGVAPLAISDQWHTITELMVAVATSDLADPATADKLRDQAVAATKAVNEVRVYAQATCGVDLSLAGVPSAGATTVPTTVAGAETTAPPTPPPTLPSTVPPTVP